MLATQCAVKVYLSGSAGKLQVTPGAVNQRRGLDRNGTPNKMGSVDDQLFVAVKLTTLIPCTCFFGVFF